METPEIEEVVVPAEEAVPAPEKVEIPRDEWNKIVDKIANLEQDKVNTVEELKKLRIKRASAEPVAITEEPEIDILDTNGGGIDEKTAQQLIDEALNARDVKGVAERRAAMLEQFRSSKVEIKIENDPAGIKFDAFRQKLSRFNIGETASDEDYLSALEDAYRLMTNATPSKDGIVPAPQVEEPVAAPSEPTIVKDDQLTSQEKRMIDTTLGGDTAMYLRQKAARPAYVASMLKHFEAY